MSLILIRLKQIATGTKSALNNSEEHMNGNTIPKLFHAVPNQKHCYNNPTNIARKQFVRLRTPFRWNGQPTTCIHFTSYHVADALHQQSHSKRPPRPLDRRKRFELATNCRWFLECALRTPQHLLWHFHKVHDQKSFHTGDAARASPSW